MMRSSSLCLSAMVTSSVPTKTHALDAGVVARSRIDLGCGIMGVDQNGQADASSGKPPSDGNESNNNETPTLLSSEDIAEVERLLGDAESRTRP